MPSNPEPSPMSAPKNSLLAFFASVQLALFLLGLLASTAIIGTIIPQNADPMFYTERYGLARTRFFELLDLGDMYNSWWFLGLLAPSKIGRASCRERV